MKQQARSTQLAYTVEAVMTWHMILPPGASCHRVAEPRKLQTQHNISFYCNQWQYTLLSERGALLFPLAVALCADCGAGVGRVSQQLLLHHFNTVDLLEPSKHLIDAAQKNIKAAIASSSYPKGHALGLCLCQGLQEFVPEPQRCGIMSHWHCQAHCQGRSSEW